MKPLMILAMHRSGTSLVASWLERCGISLTIGGAMGPAIGNERGHFEDVEFVNLHRSSIERQVRRSWGWRVRYAQPLSFDQSERARARALVESRQALNIPWGWKDPRTILFAREWKEIIPDLQVLVLRRDPCVVIESMVRRGRKSTDPSVRISYVESAAVFHAYNKLLARFIRAHHQSVIEVELHDMILDGGRRIRDKVGRACGFELRSVELSDLYDNRMLSFENPPVAARLLSFLPASVCRCAWCERIPRRPIESVSAKLSRERS